MADLKGSSTAGGGLVWTQTNLQLSPQDERLFYKGSEVVDTKNNQTISGKKDFVTGATVPDPKVALDVANKGYVDRLDSGSIKRVTGTAPIVVTAGVNPVVSINPSTKTAAGSMSAADKTKLDNHPTNVVNRDGDAMTGDLRTSGLIHADKPITSKEYIGVTTGDYSNRTYFSSGAWYIQSGKTDRTPSDQKLVMSGWLNVPLSSFKIQMAAGSQPQVRVGTSDYDIFHKGNLPTPDDVGSVSRTGDSMSGNLSFPTSGTGITLWGSSSGLYGGNGDGATQDKTNIQIKSWYGVGIAPTAGSSLEPGKNSVWINARNGDIETIGNTISSRVQIKSAAPAVYFNETDADKTYILISDGGSYRLHEENTGITEETMIFRARNENKHFEMRNPTSFTPQLQAINALTRKDYVDGEISKQVAKSGDTMTGKLMVRGEIQTSSSNSYRHTASQYGSFWRMDGTNLYLMLTNKDDPFGNYNAFRPFRVELATGRTFISGESYVLNESQKIFHDKYAPRLITHNYLDSVDVSLNDLKEPGSITFSRFSAQVKDRPSVLNSANVVMNIATVGATSTSSYGHQLAFSSDGKMYTRYNNNADWNKWAQIYTSEAKPTPGDLNAVSRDGDTINGNLTISSPITQNTDLLINSAPTKESSILFRNDNKTRWKLYQDGSTESGANVGSDFVLRATADNGTTILGNVFVARRATQIMEFVKNPVVISSQSTAGNSLTRKDYVDGEISKQVAKSGDTMTGSLTIKGALIAQASSGIRTEKQTTDGSSASISAEAGYVMLWKRNDSTTISDEFVGIRNSSLIFRKDNGTGDRRYSDHYVYHTGNRPTPGDLNAVNKTGDIMTGNLTLKPVGINAELALDSEETKESSVLFKNKSKARWKLYQDTGVESGNNAGSDFALKAYDDDGAQLDSAFVVRRSSQITEFRKNPISIDVQSNASNALTRKDYVDTTFVKRNEVSSLGNWENIINKIPRHTGNGILEVGRYLDMHTTDSTKDFDVRIEATTSGNLVINPVSGKTTTFFADGAVISDVFLVKLAQDTRLNALTRKDYVDGEISKQVAKSGDTMTGTLNLVAASSSKNGIYGVSQGGSFAAMHTAHKPITIESSITGNTFAPALGMRYTHNSGWNGTYSLGTLNYNAKSSGAFVISHINSGAGETRIWEFKGTDGGLNIPGPVAAQGNITTTGQIYTDRGGDAIVIDSTFAQSAYLRGRVNGTDSWYIGRGSANSQDVTFGSPAHDTYFQLGSLSIYSNKNILIGAGQSSAGNALTRKDYVDGIVSQKAPTNHNHTAAQGNHDIVAGGYAQLGTYVLASKITGPTFGIGQLAEGSALIPASAGNRYQDGVTLPGGWKCLGYAHDTSAEVDQRTTLWIRVT